MSQNTLNQIDEYSKNLIKSIFVKLGILEQFDSYNKSGIINSWIVNKEVISLKLIFNYKVKNQFINLKPELFNDFTKLKHLSIYNWGHNNKFTIAPNLLNKLNNLEELRFGIQIKTLNSTFLENQKKLKILDLRRIGLENLEEGCFKNLTKLEELLLGYFEDPNPINQLNETVFYPLTGLQILHISMLNLDELSQDIFSKNLQLNQLYIYGNNLESLPQKIFRNLTNLEIINMEGNYLENLDQDLFSSNFKLNQIILQANNFKTLPMLRHLNELEVLYLKNTQIPIQYRKNFTGKYIVQQFILNNSTFAYYVPNIFEKMGIGVIIILSFILSLTIDTNAFYFLIPALLLFEFKIKPKVLSKYLYDRKQVASYL